jgi:hypothetical protein
MVIHIGNKKRMSSMYEVEITPCGNSSIFSMPRYLFFNTLQIERSCCNREEKRDMNYEGGKGKTIKNKANDQKKKKRKKK